MTKTSHRAILISKGKAEQVGSSTKRHKSRLRTLAKRVKNDRFFGSATKGKEQPMNKMELIDEITEMTGETRKSVSEILEAFTKAVKTAVNEGDTVKLAGFGVFKRTERSEKRIASPADGKPMTIPAKKRPVFTASQKWKDECDM